MYNANVGVHTIAKRHGTTLSKVRHALRRAGVTLRSRAEARSLRALREGPDDTRIAEAYTTTRSMERVCARFHFTKNTVIASLRRSGIEIAPPGGQWKHTVAVRREAVGLAGKRGLRVAAKQYGVSMSTMQHWKKTLPPERVLLPESATCEGCYAPTEGARLCDSCMLAS